MRIRLRKQTKIGYNKTIFYPLNNNIYILLHVSLRSFLRATLLLQHVTFVRKRLKIIRIVGSRRLPGNEQIPNIHKIIPLRFRRAHNILDVSIVTEATTIAV